jgi:protoporphyrinogen oxidase
MKIFVIGLGPTGLGFLSAFNEDLTSETNSISAVDTNSYFGGLSYSDSSRGYRIEAGSHIFHSHYAKFNEITELTCPMVSNKRISLIRFLDEWIPYPFQSNVHLISDKHKIERDQMLEGLKEAHNSSIGSKNMEEWAVQKMGKPVYDLFYKPLNTKSWSVDPKELGTSWVGDRVPPAIVATSKAPSITSWGPNSTFMYPVFGGSGVVWSTIGEDLKSDKRISIGLGCHVDAIRLNGKFTVAYTNSDEDFMIDDDIDIIVNTGPITELVEMLPNVPEEVSIAVKKLKSNRLIIVRFGMIGEIPEAIKDATWIYFPESKYPWYRIGVSSNISPKNAPHGCWSIMFECSSTDKLNKESLENLEKECVQGVLDLGFINDIKYIDDINTKQYPLNYPLPTIDRDSSLSIVQKYLESMGIYSRGRFGGWKYEVGNMDHSFMQGYELYNRLFKSIPEITYFNPEEVNSGRAFLSNTSTLK